MPDGCKCRPYGQKWKTNGMALNPDKSHAILFDTAQRAQSFSDLHSIDIAGSATPLDSHIKLLGVTLDSHLSMFCLNLCHSPVFITFMPCATYAVC